MDEPLVGFTCILCTFRLEYVREKIIVSIKKIHVYLYGKRNLENIFHSGENIINQTNKIFPIPKICKNHITFIFINFIILYSLFSITFLLAYKLCSLST